MRVLVLGGSGYVGRKLLEALRAMPWALPACASRGRVDKKTDGVEYVCVDTRDLIAMTAALKGFDSVVNCVAGDERSISEGASVLIRAALAANCRRIVHVSTMSVYGLAEGFIREDAPLDIGAGWYGRAKCEAESSMREFSRSGGETVTLRPGCVFGPGSELWVGRIARWLRAGRLGDLGVAGDGWSNLVHIDDVCRALVASLQLPLIAGQFPVFNLAAPDSPRWNDYFVDLALELKAVPVKRISPLQLKLDTCAISPPLKVAQRAFKSVGLAKPGLPDPMPPGLARLWAQHIRLDATLARHTLGLTWTPYMTGLKNSAEWAVKACAPHTLLHDKPLFTPG